MPQRDEKPQSKLEPWVVPWAIGSLALIVVGILATYANTTVGAAIVLVGLAGVIRVAVGAARSVD